jgi:hypothetical protein
VPARDPLSSYRATGPAQAIRHQSDDGEAFIGFGPEGTPDFLSRPIKPASAA